MPSDRASARPSRAPLRHGFWFTARAHRPGRRCDMRRTVMIEPSEQTTTATLASTGIAGLDHVLHGGLPRGHLYLVEGDPGSGKTTLGMQFLLDGRDRGESTL